MEIAALPRGLVQLACKLAFKKKYNADGTVSSYKMRLVCHGYEQSVVQRPRRSLHWAGTGSRKTTQAKGGNGTRAGWREVTRARVSPPGGAGGLQASEPRKHTRTGSSVCREPTTRDGQCGDAGATEPGRTGTDLRGSEPAAPQKIPNKG